MTFAALAADPSTTGGVALLLTALALGLRHGIDWDHIAAIADITSTTAATEAAEDAHEAAHDVRGPEHEHAHGGSREQDVHSRELDVDVSGASEPTTAVFPGAMPVTRQRFLEDQRRSVGLGSLYAFGHAAVVIALGLAALTFGALLPSWIDPIMGRVVGVTLVLLGLWVLYSAYGYVRHGSTFRLRSRWMLAFDSVRYGWRWFGAKIHGHRHVEPLEASAYGPKTAFTVGAIHGIGAETGTQVLLIAALGGAAGAGLGVPMLLAFVVGLLISNTVIVVISATGFVASQTRQRLYVAVGVVAGVFSLIVGVIFLAGADAILPVLATLPGGT
jgi:high-affinity nickel-transport protein